MTLRSLPAALLAAACLALAACGSAAPAPGTATSTATAHTAGSTHSHDATHGLGAQDAWVQAAPTLDGMAMTAAFVTLTNPTDADITVLSATQDASGRTEIHETVRVDGRPVMRPVAAGLIIPAGQRVELKPGGHHLMLMGLKRPLPVGAEVTFTARTSTGQEVRWTAPAKQFTAPPENYVPGSGHATGTGGATSAPSASSGHGAAGSHDAGHPHSPAAGRQTPSS